MTVIEKGIIAEVAVIALLLLLLIVLVLKPSKTGKRNAINKGMIVGSYIIALLCLWAGLLVPAYGTGGELVDRMLIFYIPDTINKIVGRQLINWNMTRTFTETYAKTVFGLQINLLAYALAVYAFFAVLGIPMLIPVLCGSRKRKTSLVFAGIVEVPAALALELYVMFFSAGSQDAFINYGALVAMGGVLLMLACQCIASKHGALGIYKVWMYILSALGVLALADITVVMEIFTTPFAKLADLLKSSVGFIGTTIGFYYLSDCILNVNQIGTIIAGMSALGKAMAILAMVTAALVTLNMIFDTLALGAGAKYDKKGNEKHNHASKRFELIRYLLQLICAILTVILAMLAKETVGIYLYAIVVISFLQFIAAVIRLARRVPEAQEDYYEEDSKAAAKATVKLEESPEEESLDATEEQTTVAPVYVYQDTAADSVDEELSKEQKKQLKKEEAMNKKLAKEEAKKAEDKPKYDGPTDDFIETLDDDQKFEFKDTFLDKNKGTISGLPDYQVGEENKDFYENFFIYLGSLHKTVSDGLLQKVYQRATNVNS
jgi:hypothetical protein